jgi:hypothetical protein
MQAGGAGAGGARGNFDQLLGRLSGFLKNLAGVSVDIPQISRQGNNVTFLPPRISKVNPESARRIAALRAAQAARRAKVTTPAPEPGFMDSLKGHVNNLTPAQIGAGLAVPAGLMGLLHGSQGPEMPPMGQMAMPGSPLLPNFPIHQPAYPPMY